MTRHVAHIRVPAAIEGSVAGPYAEQMLEHPDDGEIVAQDGDAQDGIVRIAFDADDLTDAQLHARLLAERAPGCEVADVRADDDAPDRPAEDAPTQAPGAEGTPAQPTDDAPATTQAPAADQSTMATSCWPTDTPSTPAPGAQS